VLIMHIFYEIKIT